MREEDDSLAYVWAVVPGLDKDPHTVSLESIIEPGHYLNPSTLIWQFFVSRVLNKILFGLSLLFGRFSLFRVECES